MTGEDRRVLMFEAGGGIVCWHWLKDTTREAASEGIRGLRKGRVCPECLNMVWEVPGEEQPGPPKESES